MGYAGLAQQLSGLTQRELPLQNPGCSEKPAALVARPQRVAQRLSRRYEAPGSHTRVVAAPRC